jgi:sugar/nucleoside kinase (ribokinase family)
MILGLGCIAHDLILVTETPWESGKGRVLQSETRFGGNVRNALATVAALDHPAGYLGAIGTSLLGDEAVADLADYGISTEYVERVAGADPVASRITVTAGGERYIAFDDAPLARTPLPSEDIVARALDVAGALLIDACVAPPGSLEVVERARDRGVPVVLDAERDPSPTVLALVAAADHLVVPRTFGSMVTGLEDPAAIAEALWNDKRAVVVLTEGTAGAHAFDAPGAGVHVPAFPATAVDTTGCGDAFHGGYAWSLLAGADLHDRVVIASAAAAVLAGLPAGTRRVATRASIAAYTPGMNLP